jgi:hypothetical protein
MKLDQYIERPGATFSECKILISDPDPISGQRTLVIADSQGNPLLRGVGGRVFGDPIPEDTRPWWKKLFD